MARSLIRRRQEAERQRTQAYDATLRRARRAVRAAPDFEGALAEAVRGFENDIVRIRDDWRPKLKTRDEGRLRLAAARHLFARFPVCGALERVWLDTTGLAGDEIRLRKRWYVAAARGGSLYRETEAGGWLTRKEVHRFLNPTGDPGFDEAVWQAIARSYTDDLGVALRIARSRIVLRPRSEIGFWREAVRLFCVEALPLERANDLVDYLVERRRRDRAFSLAGRTVASLERMMREWHEDLAAIARIEAARRRVALNGRSWMRDAGDGRWEGSPLEDWCWRPNSREAKALNEEYRVRQLRTAASLVDETRVMHHCVSTYASRCVSGQSSIWSLARRDSRRGEQRLLTIELDRQNRAVQVRGLANRLPGAAELQVLSRWAKARGIALA